MSSRWLRSIVALSALVVSACGVKGPPLPPLAVTPQSRDRAAAPAPDPSDIPGVTRKRLPTD